MSKPQINAVITANGLKAGDTMVNVHGEPIPGSVVLDNYTFVHPEGGPQGGFRLVHERPIHGDEMSQFLSHAAMRALKSVDTD